MLMSSTASLIKIAEITQTTKPLQPALFIRKKATLPENTALSHLNIPILLLPTTSNDTRYARYTIKGIITTPKYPNNRAMPKI